MKQAPFVIFLLLLGVAAALFVWGGEHEPVLPADTAPPAPLHDRAEDASVGLSAPEEAGDAVPGELPEGLRELVREESEAGAGALVVQVWDGKPGVPAPQAEVHFIDGFQGPELGDPFAQHWSTFAESRGRRFRTDLQGRVELPRIERWAIVTAARPGAYGFLKLGPKHKEVETIVLQPDETVTVRVVDGEGRPVRGAPVGIVQRIPVRASSSKIDELLVQMKALDGQMARVKQYVRDNPEQRDAVTPRVQGLVERQKRIKIAIGDLKRQEPRTPRARSPQSRPSEISTRLDVRARRHTGEDGIAEFRHFQVYRQEHEKWWPPPQVDRFEAVLLMPLQQPVSRPFRGRPVPSDTLELQLPETGSIALRPVDHDGRAFTHPVQATLRMQGSEPVPWSSVTARKAQDEAVMVFPFVGLGLQFTAQCRLDDDDFRWSTPAFPGPTSPGDRATIDVVVAPTAGMLHGRLLDADGRPLAGARPTFLINCSAGRLEGEDLTLDPGGRFHLPFHVRDGQRPPFRLEIRRDDVRPTTGCVKSLPALVPGRVTDLGDLRLGTFQRVAFGQVIDDRGQPIAGASVQLQREREVGGKSTRLLFVDEAFSVVRTDADGRYELFAELEPARYRLRAQAREHFPFDGSDLVQGEQARIQLLRKSRVVGTVKIPPWLPDRRVRVALELAADPRQRREDQLHGKGSTTYIWFDWVRAGLYRLELRLEDFPDPVLQIDGLEVRPGQQDLHPRLTELDLAAYLFHFEIVAVDQDGQAVHPNGPLLARITRPGGRTGFVGFPWRGSKLEIVSASPQLPVIPLTHGYRAEPTTLRQGRSELRFFRIPPVELHVPGLRRLVGTLPVMMLMHRTEAGELPEQLETWDRRSGRIASFYRNRSRSTGGPLGDDDKAQIPVMADGRYRVRALLGDRQKGGAAEVPLGVVDVRLLPGSGPLRLPVAFDVEQVQQALAEVAGRPQNGR